MMAAIRGPLSRSNPALVGAVDALRSNPVGALNDAVQALFAGGRQMATATASELHDVGALATSPGHIAERWPLPRDEQVFPPSFRQHLGQQFNAVGEGIDAAMLGLPGGDVVRAQQEAAARQSTEAGIHPAGQFGIEMLAPGFIGKLASGLATGAKAVGGLMAAAPVAVDAQRATPHLKAVPDEFPADASFNSPETPVSLRGKPIAEWGPADFHEYGKKYGVPNLGPEDEQAWRDSLEEVVATNPRPQYANENPRVYTIPGGLDSEEPFTYYDLLHLKQQAIDPNELPPGVHQKIHDRIMKTMDGPGPPSDTQIFNQLSFAIMSSNNPLTPNELGLARMMAKGPEDIRAIGSLIPWKPRASPQEVMDAVYKEADPEILAKIAKDKKFNSKSVGDQATAVRWMYSAKIQKARGIQAAKDGGIGATGSANATYLAELGKMMTERPDFFRFDPARYPGMSPEEQWKTFVNELSTQTLGLGPKTGSFGAVWQAPSTADISAVDRWMAKAGLDDMLPTDAEKREWMKGAVVAFNNSQAVKYDKARKTYQKDLDRYTKAEAKYKQRVQAAKKAGRKIPERSKSHPEKPKKQKKGRKAKSFADITNVSGGEGFLSDYALKLTTKSGDKKKMTGKLVPDHYRDVDWVTGTPTHVEMMGPYYERALEGVAGRARERGQHIFSSQWYEWDKLRQRLEPHEIMFPGLEKLPRMDMDQIRAVRDRHSDAGYLADRGPVRPLLNVPTSAYWGLGGVAAGSGLGALSQKNNERTY